MLPSALPLSHCPCPSVLPFCNPKYAQPEDSGQWAVDLCRLVLGAVSLEVTWGHLYWVTMNATGAGCPHVAPPQPWSSASIRAGPMASLCVASVFPDLVWQLVQHLFIWGNPLASTHTLLMGSSALSSSGSVEDRLWGKQLSEKAVAGSQRNTGHGLGQSAPRGPAGVGWRRRQVSSRVSDFVSHETSDGGGTAVALPTFCFPLLLLIPSISKQMRGKLWTGQPPAQEVRTLRRHTSKSCLQILSEHQ